MSDYPTMVAPPASRRPSEMGTQSYLSDLLPTRDLVSAYLFTAFSLIGICGLQHLYLGRKRRAVLWLLTFGLFGVGTIIDVVTLPAQVDDSNARRSVGIR